MLEILLRKAFSLGASGSTKDTPRDFTSSGVVMNVASFDDSSEKPNDTYNRRKIAMRIDSSSNAPPLY